MLTGKPESLAALRPDLPPQLVAAVEKAFTRSPSARHQSIAELVGALAPFAPPHVHPIIDRIRRLASRSQPIPPSALGHSVAPSVPPPASAAPPRSARTMAIVAATLGVIATIAIVAAVSLWLGRGHAGAAPVGSAPPASASP